MKKERVILFPENKNIGLENDHNCINALQEIRIGQNYSIGQPSNRYYEYIHPVIDPGKMSVNEFEDFRIIEGKPIIVMSILVMADGKRIAVLRNYENKPFVGKIEQIFARIDMSITSREIITTEPNL
jgi:hypothetical protein